jgi:hypothetical protein
MSFGIRRSVVALVAGGMLFGSSAALATEERPNLEGCVKLSHQVSNALEANAQSKNIDDARDENKAGHQFCDVGMYKMGLEHYSKALELLTPDKG